MKSLFNKALVLALISTGFAGSVMAYNEIDKAHAMQDNMLSYKRIEPFAQQPVSRLSRIFRTVNPTTLNQYQFKVDSGLMDTAQVPANYRAALWNRVNPQPSMKERASVAVKAGKGRIASAYAAVKAGAAQGYAYVKNNPSYVAKKAAIATMATVGAYAAVKYAVKPYVLDPLYAKVLKPAYDKVKGMFATSKKTQPAKPVQPVKKAGSTKKKTTIRFKK